MKFKCEAGYSRLRLDKVLALKLPELSRSGIQKIIKGGGVLVNGDVTKVGYVLNEGDSVVVDLQFKADSVEDVNFEEANVEILYEDVDFLVVDKPAGMVVHPTESGDARGTLVSVLSDKIEDGVGEDFRPGVVHRLDKDTSGVLIIARTRFGYDYFVEQFKKRRVRKVYLALVKGALEFEEGVIDSPIGRDLKDRKRMSVLAGRVAKEAISRYRVVRELNLDEKTVLSLLEVEIETGRTHQIRVHMAAIGHVVVGDGTYGVGSFNKKVRDVCGLKRQFLHAHILEFRHPKSGDIIKVRSELPDDLRAVLDGIQ